MNRLHEFCARYRTGSPATRWCIAAEIRRSPIMARTLAVAEAWVEYDVERSEYIAARRRDRPDAARLLRRMDRAVKMLAEVACAAYLGEGPRRLELAS